MPRIAFDNSGGLYQRVFKLFERGQTNRMVSDCYSRRFGEAASRKSRVVGPRQLLISNASEGLAIDCAKAAVGNVRLSSMPF